MMPQWIQRHRGSVLLAFLLLTCAGIMSLRALPVGLFPLIDFPRIVVSVDAGDRPVDRMVVEVTRPLEQALRSVPDVKTIRSNTSRGSAEFSLSFGWGTDMVTALLQTQAEVNAALSSLPAGTSFGIRRMDPTVFPVLGLSLTSPTRSQTSLRDVAQYQIAPELTAIGGVAKVDLMGGRQAEYHVLLDPVQLQSYGLTPADVSTALSASNVVTAVGRVEDRYRLYLILSDSRLQNQDDIGKTILRSGKDGIVELEDVGTVALGQAPEWTRVNADGKDAVLLNIMQQRGANTVAMVTAVQDKLALLRASLPPDITIRPYYDQSELIVSSAGSVRDAIVIGAVLAGLVLLVFLRNKRITLIVSLVLPMVLLISGVALHLAGQSLNIMTLGGMAAAVGLVVDDAVVMIEHMARRLVQHTHEGPTGQSPPVLKFAMEMFRPLTGSSAATVGVFLPLAFLSGVAGGFFRPLAITMAFTLMVSYCVALFVVPILTKMLVRPEDAESLEKSGRWQRSIERQAQRGLQLGFKRPVFLLVPIMLLVVVGAFAYRLVGSGFMPRMDEGGFIFDYRAAPGTSLTESDRLMQQVEAIVRSLPEVESYSRRTGMQLGGSLSESNEGDMFIKLKPMPRRGIEEVMTDLRARVEASVPGLQVETAQLMEDLIGDLTSTPQPIEVKLFGPDDTVLRAQAGRVAQAISKIQGVVEVFDGSTIAGDAIQIKVDRVRTSLEKLTPDEVTQQVDALLNGVPSSSIQTGEQMLAVRVWTPESLRQRLDQIARLPIRGPDGQTLPLSRVAAVTIEQGQMQQARENLRPMVAVTGRLEGIDLGSAMQAVQAEVQALNLPAPIVVEYGGLYDQQKQSFRDLSLVFVAAFLIVATLLMFLYERASIVLSILATILLTLPAVFIGLWVTGTELNLSSMIGLTMIIGIVTEVAIFYFAELETSEPINIEDLKQAATARLRPILMTSLIAILALMPLALGIGSGSEMQRPLAITIIAGLLVAVPMVLVAMPAIFWLIDKKASSWRGREHASA
ncbi:efflux RND transporter permease subunit [Pseudoxanthomonas mexicana]|nr:efflux RND transporter permease subunit [Pseudoxanthomonas mexicana]